MTPEDWAEYKRRLALKDERKAEIDRCLGFHSSVLAGSSVVTDFLPTPNYAGATMADTGNRPQFRQKKRGRPTNLSKKRIIVPIEREG